MSVFEPIDKSYWLAKLCEANYERLLRLIPDLSAVAKCAVASAEGKPCLYLELLEQSHYTITLELSHSFSKELEALLEPAVRIRVYLDARVAEVLSDHARPRVHEALKREYKAREVMDYKWSLNYFFSRWLEHCLACNYRFGVVQTEPCSCQETA